jgi:hypothetical protein
LRADVPDDSTHKLIVRSRVRQSAPAGENFLRRCGRRPPPPEQQGLGGRRGAAPRPTKLYISAANLKSRTPSQAPSQGMISQSILFACAPQRRTGIPAPTGRQSAGDSPGASTATLVTGGTLVDGKSKAALPGSQPLRPNSSASGKSSDAILLRTVCVIPARGSSI